MMKKNKNLKYEIRFAAKRIVESAISCANLFQKLKYKIDFLMILERINWLICCLKESKVLSDRYVSKKATFLEWNRNL
jgi:hypothetical protein